jgi:RHS repeat-associated protein
MQRKRLGLLILAIAIVAALFPPALRAQGYYYQFGQQPYTTAIPVTGGYIDATNGDLHIEIPIASIAERGRVPYVAKLVYDSHIWQQGETGGTVSWQPNNVAGFPTAWGGWRLVTTAGTGSGVSYTTGTGTCYIKNGNLEIPHPYITFNSFRWTAPDGHVVPFTGGTSYSNPCWAGTETTSGLADDASGYHLYVTDYTSATVFAPDGTQVYPNVEDTNGNYYSVPNSNGDVTDTRGQTPITTTIGTNSVTYVVQSSEASYSVVLNTTSIPVNTSFGATGVTEYSGNMTVIQSITLPEGETYEFGYDQGATGSHFGTLTSMTLPTGGAVSYDSNAIFKDAYNQENVYTKSYSYGGGTWTISPSVVTTCGTSCTEQVETSTPSGDQQLYTFTMYGGSMWNTQTNTYSGSVASGTLLQYTVTAFNASSAVQPVTFTTVVSTPTGSLTRKSTVTWDTTNYGNVVALNQWNYYPGTLPASPDRIYSYSYLPNTNDANMINKRTETKITGNGQTYSDLVVTYDSYGSSGLTGITGTVSNFDSANYGSSNTARGNPTSESYGGLTTATLSYDITGQILSVADAANNTTNLSYTDCYLVDGLPPTSYTPTTKTNAFPTTIRFANGQIFSECYYWGSGKLASQTDANTQATAFHYLDTEDRHTHTIPPLGWTEWVYSGNQTEIDTYTSIGATSPTTNCSAAGSCRHDADYFDGFGRAEYSQLVNDPDGSAYTSYFSYDTSGRISSSANPYRTTSEPTYGVETASYDGLNRTTQIAHADSNTIKAYFGPSITTLRGANSSQLCSGSLYNYGFPSVTIDEAGNMKEYWIDGFGRTIEVDEPVSTGSPSSYTCYSYLANDSIAATVHVVGSQNQTRSYFYDSLGRVITVSTPEASDATVYTYPTTGSFCSGNPSTICTRRDGRGVVTTYSYDILNRLTGFSYSDGLTPSVTYCYDGNNTTCGTSNTYGGNVIGRRSAIKDGSGSTAWTFDGNGRVVSESRTIGSVSRTIAYTYNGDGSRASVTYPSGRKVKYTVGNAGRAQSATDANGTQYAVMAGYTPAGPLAAVFYGQVQNGFGGFNSSQSFDKRWDLVSIQSTSSAGSAINLNYCFYPLVSGTCPAAGSSNNGTLYVMSNGNDSGRTETVSYDSLARVTSAKTQATSGIDCWGQSFTVDPVSNLTTIQSTQTGCTVGTLSASVNGISNQLSFGPPSPSYDNDGNMTNDGVNGYTFDGEHRVIASSNSPIQYVYDGLGMRVEKTATSYYWRAVTGEILAETDTSGNTKNEYIYFAGQRIAWLDGATPQQNLYYINTDNLGSTRTIVEANGTLCYDSEYTPYGQELNHTSTCPSTFSFRFTGYEWDSETRLNYAFARYYSSRLGRFLSPDQSGGDLDNPQNLNRYSYALNSPTNLTDPLGLGVGDCPQGFVWDPNSKSCIPFNPVPIVGTGGPAPPSQPPGTVVTPPNPSGGGGGGPTIGPAPSKPCVQPTWVQRLLIPLHAKLAKQLGMTVSLGLGANAGAALIVGVGYTASRSVAVSPNGQAAFITTVTATKSMPFNSLGWGWGAFAGPSISFSNAQTPQDLSGTGVSGSVGGGTGYGGGVEGSVSTGTQGQNVGSLTFSGGVAAGGAGLAGAIVTTYVTPICP